MIDSTTQKRRIAVLVFTLLSLAVLITIATHSASAWFFLGGGEWEPPDRPTTQISDREYITLWGRSSTLLDGVSTKDQARQQINDAYQEFGFEPGLINQFGAFFTTGAAVDTPRDAQMKWNENLYRMRVEDDPPIRGSANSNPPVIKGAYTQIMRPSPHTMYMFGGEKTKYIGDRVTLSLVSHIDADARPRSRNGGNITRYSIIERKYSNFTISAHANGRELDSESLDYFRGRKFLNTSNVDHGEPVSFQASGDILIKERMEKYRWVCEEKETRSWTAPGTNTTYTYEICTEYRKETIDTEVFNHTVAVDDRLSGYVKYRPEVDITYNYERISNRQDRYYLDVETNAPIESVNTGNEEVDFGTAYFVGRDTRFDDEMGAVQPMNHYAVQGTQKPYVDNSTQLDTLVDIVDYNGYRQPQNAEFVRDEFRLNLQSDTDQLQPNRAVLLGKTDRGQTFDLSDTKVRPILPKYASVNVSYQESKDFNFEKTNLITQYQKNKTDTYNQSVSIRLMNESGQPIDTANMSHLHMEVSNVFAGIEKTVQTNATGEANDVFIRAAPGDTLTVELKQTNLDSEPDEIYISKTDEKVIARDINYDQTFDNIFTAAIMWFVDYILPTAIVLSLINYGFTGRFLPKDIKQKLKIGSGL
jgi:hypothetical protein